MTVRRVCAVKVLHHEVRVRSRFAVVLEPWLVIALVVPTLVREEGGYDLHSQQASMLYQHALSLDSASSPAQSYAPQQQSTIQGGSSSGYYTNSNANMMNPSLPPLPPPQQQQGVSYHQPRPHTAPYPSSTQQHRPVQPTPVKQQQQWLPGAPQPPWALAQSHPPPPPPPLAPARMQIPSRQQQQAYQANANPYAQFAPPLPPLPPTATATAVCTSTSTSAVSAAAVYIQSVPVSVVAEQTRPDYLAPSTLKSDVLTGFFRS